MTSLHRYECRLKTSTSLIELTVYAPTELTVEEVESEALKQYSQAETTHELQFVGYKYVGDYSGFED